MKRRIDSKYEIVAFSGGKPGTNGIKIVNVYNGNEIPEDEPLFIFRAKDRLAIKSLAHYFCSCVMDECTSEQVNSLANTIIEWAKWQKNNPDKMKQPGITMPEDMKKLVARDKSEGVKSLVAIPKDDGVKS